VVGGGVGGTDSAGAVGDAAAGGGGVTPGGGGTCDGGGSAGAAVGGGVLGAADEACADAKFAISPGEAKRQTAHPVHAGHPAHKDRRRCFEIDAEPADPR